ncbi:MAG: alpha/beta hydrolase [Spirochaetaceae bacterium]|nr:alpha/beta hydrolase [Spirochaetaceae bacterium]
MTRLFPWLIAIPAVLLIALSLPWVQRVFIPMPDAMDRLEAESRRKPQAEPPVHSDLVYRRTFLRSHRLDIYEPLGPFGPGRAPVVIFLHGGSWIHGDKVTIRVVDRFLSRMREAGYFVIAPNYTTSVLRGLDGALENAEAAIRWVVDHAEEYGYDPRNIGLYGVSAGGHLALVAASTMVPSDFSFSFVFAECAPSDLVAMREGEAFEHSGNFRFFRLSRLEELSPVNLVSAALAPILLFHGGADQVVAIEQSERYAEAATSAGVHVEFVRYPEGDHGFLNLPDEVWYQQETRALGFFADQFRHDGG